MQILDLEVSDHISGSLTEVYLWDEAKREIKDTKRKIQKKDILTLR
jgi:hypothetical protein